MLYTTEALTAGKCCLSASDMLSFCLWHDSPFPLQFVFALYVLIIPFARGVLPLP